MAANVGRSRLKVALVQINPTIADLQGNAEKILNRVLEAEKIGASLVIFPELALTAYPPRDLLLRQSFVRDTVAAAKTLAKKIKKIPVLFGLPWPSPYRDGKPLVNAALLANRGKIEKLFYKKLLPEYDVFDERRYFESSREKRPAVFAVGKTRFGVTICEDLWDDAEESGRGLYSHSPVKALAGKCDILINIAASPFHVGKYDLRQDVFKKTAARIKRPILYVNQIGSHDDLLFDGRSQVLGKNGRSLMEAKSFEEDFLLFETSDLSKGKKSPVKPGLPAFPPKDEIALVHQGLVLGIKDYFRKTGFSQAVLGLSGGIDSALVAVLAAEALGKENVICVTMPSPFSSTGSVDDSVDLAKRNGLHLDRVAIAPAMEVFEKSLSTVFGEPPSGLTLENLQSRIRGNILMAYANRRNALVLNTGNKSELAMGYCTLYGDMNGGLSVLGDLTKTRVYELSRYLNRNGEIIPKVIIDKEPSAELRPGQKDTDSLPPYNVLDPMLEALIEKGLSENELVQQGHKRDLIASTIRKYEINEYKRFQSPPILKITATAFGPGRRIPLARKF